MKYLGHPEATLVTMWVTARHLTVSGASSRESLFSALRPSDLTSGDGLGLSNSLLCGADLGLFREGQEASPLIDNAEILGDHQTWFDEFDGFAAIARRLLMTQSSRSSQDRSDVASGVCWLMSRDWRRPQDALGKKDDAPDDIVKNSTQFNAFRRWCRELGFAGPDSPKSKDGIAADPTSAIRRDLTHAPAGRLTARRFVQWLSETIPAGPTHPLSMELNRDRKPADDLQVFSSVGFALKRLQSEGRIELLVADDARERMIFPFPGPSDAFIPVTHIEVAR